MQAGILIGKRGDVGKEVARCAQVVFESKGAFCRVGGRPSEVAPDFYDHLDALLAVGGDGTILYAAGEAARRGIPVLGINLGRLGFLSEVEPEGIEEAVLRLLEGNYRLEYRLMLEARAADQYWYALNEIVLEGLNRGRLMWFESAVDECKPDRVACDGVMVASPTGSTAYSLSCGGPILSPELDAMVLTTICAHTLRARPLVVGPRSVITLRSGDRADVTLYADGRREADFSCGECVTVRRAPFDLQMVRFAQGDFTSLARRKLAEWSLE